MGSEWQETTIAEFTPFTYGKGLPERRRNINGNIPVYGSNGVVGYHDVPLTDGPTVVIGRKGTVGAVHYSPVACWPIDTTFFITGSDSAQVRYCYYVLKTLGLEHMNSDSAVPGLNREAAHSRRVRIPLDKGEQHAIACILGALDDKIELNRRMNETLEAMARAIFKSWFVDFDPVRAKTKGQQPAGLASHTADLFPDSFEDSELGKIPKGWKVESLDKTADFLNGIALQKYPPIGAETLPVIKIAQLRSGNSTGADRCNLDVPPEYIVNDGDVLFSWSGSLECVLWSGRKGALNQHLFKVSSSKYAKWFYYLWIHEHLSYFRHIAAGKATTMGHIQRHHLTDAKVVIPDERVLNKADVLLGTMIEKCIRFKIESRTLAALRDTMLPKLISGQLQVTDAERVVGRCV